MQVISCLCCFGNHPYSAFTKIRTTPSILQIYREKSIPAILAKNNTVCQNIEFWHTVSILVKKVIQRLERL